MNTCLCFVNPEERALASGTAWYVAPTAGPGLVPSWEEAESAERGEKGVLCLSYFHLTGFKADSEFFSGDVTDFCLDVLQFFISVFLLLHIALFF